MQEVQQAPLPPQPQTAPQPTENRRQQVYQVASQLFRQTPDWVTFFREVLGVEGVVRRMFPTPIDLANFEASSEFGEIQQMVAKLRERNGAQVDDKEPTRVITVRLPKSLHESLRVEAHSKRTSMNKLCISKLLQVIDDQLIPQD